MRTNRISRRSLLEGLGLGALAPFVPLLEARAQRAAPRRLIVMHSPNGVGTVERWRPTGSETAFTLSEMLSPLQAFQQKLIVLDGIKNSSGAGEHTRTEAELLTGWRALRPGAKSSTRANGISVDQHVASLVGEGTRFSS